MKRVLVTGGSGFLGCHLCENLLRQGCEVLCADNFYTGSKLNVVEFLDNPCFELMRHDVVPISTAPRNCWDGGRRSPSNKVCCPPSSTSTRS